MRRCYAAAVSVAAITAMAVVLLLVRSQPPARADSTAIGSLTNSGVLTVTNPGAAADEISISLVIASGNPTGLHVVTNAPGCGTPVLAETYSDTGGPLAGRLYTTTSTLVWPTACIDYQETLTLAYTTFPSIPLPGPFSVPVEFLAGGLPVPPPTSTPGPSPTPAPGFSLQLDCDTSLPGIQADCTYLTTVGAIDVRVVFVNNSGSTVTVGPFNFAIHDPDTTRLNPPPGEDADKDSNPDFNEADVTGNWTCALPPPDNDTGEDGPGTATSFLACYQPFGLPNGPAVPSVSSIALARVQYVVPVNAQPGSVALSPKFVAVYDSSFIEIGSCEPGIDEPMPCLPATVHLVAPSVGKIPDGNANNVNSAIPAANLWLCVAPAPCAGAGEGDLRVVERATNVVTGDQNGDTLPDGLGAYEFSVEYDNFVIQSVNPCDIVFGTTGVGATRGPVDELDTSAVNADCVPDPNGANNGTCSMSAILENIIHFGCTTSGPLPPGPNGSFDLASLDLIPHPDLRNDIFPGNNNGVVTVIKDNGCELVDVFGHAVLGSVSGGLTPVCGDLAVTVRILEGDLNLDCKVDAQDQQLIAYRYGSYFGIDLYSKWFDLEPALHDLDIDIKDLQKVFGRDGSTCQDPVPAQPPLAPPAPFDD